MDKDRHEVAWEAVPATYPWAEPAPEAYGRVSNPERYRTLHQRGRDVLDRLTAEFDVERADVTGQESSPLPSDAAAPAVRLTPRDARAGPLAMVFTGFPGLAVRCGRWHRSRLPDCGCDACDEDPGELLEQLEACVSALVSGNFSERLTRQGDAWRVEYDIPGVGGGSYGVEYVQGARGEGWFSSLSGSGAGDPLQQGLPGTVEWAPWPRRDNRQ